MIPNHRTKEVRRIMMKILCLSWVDEHGNSIISLYLKRFKKNVLASKKFLTIKILNYRHAEPKREAFNRMLMSIEVRAKEFCNMRCCCDFMICTDIDEMATLGAMVVLVRAFESRCMQ
jgi:hypothetical protein